MKHLNRCFQNCKPFQNRSNHYREIMTQNLHVCTTCIRLEMVYDVISGRNVKTIKGYLVINFEVASSNLNRSQSNPQTMDGILHGAVQLQTENRCKYLEKRRRRGKLRNRRLANS